MGWKKVKEHYNITHIVEVSTWSKYGGAACIFIALPYIGEFIDIKIVIRMSDAALLRRYDRGNPNDKLRALQLRLDEDAKNGTLKRLIDEPDEFGVLLPVYCIEDGRNIVKMQCEAYGFPNVTTSGKLMYDNVFYPSRTLAERNLLYRSKIGPFWWRYVKERFGDIWRTVKPLRFEIGKVWTYIYVRCWGRFFIREERTMK